MKNGRVIVIDGMDGCGKNTQANLLYKRLKDQGNKVKIFSFPNYKDDSSFFIKKLLNGEYNNEIKSNPYLVSLFYSIDRSLTYYNEIKKYYKKGYTIIMDRYSSSNALYQLPLIEDYGEKINFILFLKHLEMDKLELPTPDITIFLTSNPEVSEKMLNNRYDNDDSKKDIYENIQMQNKVFNSITFIEMYKNMKSIRSLFGEVNTLFIHDENNNIYSIEEMSDKIISII